MASSQPRLAAGCLSPDVRRRMFVAGCSSPDVRRRMFVAGCSSPDVSMATGLRGAIPLGGPQLTG
jgi:hypothetical protein